MSLQGIKDFFKALEVFLLFISLCVGHYLKEISIEWVIVLIFLYTIINIIRVVTEPSWTTKERIKQEICKLKIYLYGEDK